MFCDEKRGEIAAAHPQKRGREVYSLLAAAWRNCSLKDRAKYQKLSQVCIRLEKGSSQVCPYSTMVQGVMFARSQAMLLWQLHVAHLCSCCTNNVQHLTGSISLIVCSSCLGCKCMDCVFSQGLLSIDCCLAENPTACICQRTVILLHRIKPAP